MVRKKSMIKYSALLIALLASASIQADTYEVFFNDNTNTGGGIESGGSITQGNRWGILPSGSKYMTADTQFTQGDGLVLNYNSATSTAAYFKSSNTRISDIIGLDSLDNNIDALVFPITNSNIFLISGANNTIEGRIDRLAILQLTATDGLSDTNQSTTIIQPKNIAGVVMTANNIFLKDYNNITFDSTNIASTDPAPLSMETRLAGGIYTTTATANQGSVSFNTIANKNIILSGGMINTSLDANGNMTAIANLSTNGTGTVTFNNGKDATGTNATKATKILVGNATFGATNTTINNTNFEVQGNATVSNGATFNLQAPTSTINTLTIPGTGILNLTTSGGSNTTTTVAGLTVASSSQISVGNNATLQITDTTPVLGKLSIAQGATVALSAGATTITVDQLTLTNSSLDLKNSTLTTNGIVVNVVAGNTTASTLTNMHAGDTISLLTLNGANFELPAASNITFTKVVAQGGGNGSSNLKNAGAIIDLTLTGATLNIEGTTPDLTGTLTVNGTSAMTGNALAKIATLSLSNGATLTLPNIPAGGSGVPVDTLTLAKGAAATLNNAGTIAGATLDGATLNLSGAPQITILNIAQNTQTTLKGAGAIGTLNMNGGKLTVQETTPAITTKMEIAGSTVVDGLGFTSIATLNLLNGANLTLGSAIPITNLTLAKDGNAVLNSAGPAENITLAGGKLTLQGGPTVKNVTVTASSSLLGDYIISGVDPVLWQVSSGANLTLDKITGLANVNFNFQGGTAAGPLILNNDVTFTAIDTIAAGVTAPPSAIAMAGDQTFTISDGVVINVPLILPVQNGLGTIVIEGAAAGLPALGTNSFYFDNVIFNGNTTLNNGNSIYATTITANSSLIASGIGANNLNMKHLIIGNAGTVIMKTADFPVGADVLPNSAAGGALELQGGGATTAAFTLPPIGQTAHILNQLTLNNLHATLGGAPFYVHDLTANTSNIELSKDVTLRAVTANNVILTLGTAQLNVGSITFTGTNTINTTVAVDGSGNITANGKIIATGTIKADAAARINVIVTATTADGLARIPASTLVEILRGVPINATISSASAASRTLAVSSELGKIEFLAVQTNPSNPGGPNVPPEKPVEFQDDPKKVAEAVKAFVANSNPEFKEVIEFIGRNIDIYPQGVDILVAAYKVKDNPEALKAITSTLNDVKQDKKSIDDLNRFIFEELPNTLPLFARDRSLDDSTRVWTSVVGRQAAQGEIADLAGYQNKSSGIFFGVTHNMSDNLTLGTAVGIIDSYFEYNGKRLTNGLNASNTVAYAYGNYRSHDGKMFLQGLGGYSRSNVNSSHSRGLAEIAQGKRTVHAFGGQAHIGYVFGVARMLSITPTVGVIKHHITERDYTETGATNWNFAVDSDSARSNTALNLGLSIAANDLSLSPETHINVYKTLLSATDGAEFAFDWSRNKSFIAGRIHPSTLFNIGGQVKAGVHGVDIEAGFDLFFGNNHYKSHQYYLGVRLAF